MRSSRLPDNIYRVLVLLLLVTAVATVLITPDPTDDIRVVVRPHKTLHAPVAAFCATYLLLLLGAGLLRRSRALHLVSHNSLQLLCTCRC